MRGRNVQLVLPHCATPCYFLSPKQWSWIQVENLGFVPDDLQTHPAVLCAGEWLEGVSVACCPLASTGALCCELQMQYGGKGNERGRSLRYLAGKCLFLTPRWVYSHRMMANFNQFGEIKGEKCKTRKG